MKTVLQIVLLLSPFYTCLSQDISTPENKIHIRGYIKNLESLHFDKSFNKSVSGNLIHNRLNLKWQPSLKITLAAEFRNRLFWGEELKTTVNYASQLRNETDKANLSVLWVNNKNILLQTNVERLYFDYQATHWNTRIGRQRINWGITTTWNPNDIFNTYNFLDFDYEERPGIDGLKYQYLFTDFSNAEMVVSQSNRKNGTIAAMRYSLNKWGYDMHLNSGWFRYVPTIGAGWAGNIDESGFKGEVQYFFSKKDSVDHFNATLEYDYVFKSGWYFNAGGLFNNRGISNSINNWDSVDFKISPKNLMPVKWSIIISASKEITPLFTGSFSTVFSPGTNLLILFPTLQYNLATNLDVHLIWQSIFAETGHHFEAIKHSGFLRLKWSF